MRGRLKRDGLVYHFIDNNGGLSLLLRHWHCLSDS